MKNCDYCGTSNVDEATHCSGCGTAEFVAVSSAEPQAGQSALRFDEPAGVKPKFALLLGIGIALQLLGKLLARSRGNSLVLIFILEISGGLLFMWGCMLYAQKKGQSKWLGLLGILSCLGFIILLALPDRNKMDGR